MLFGPLISFDAISREELNKCLVEWQHKMGPWERPNYGCEAFHGLRHSGELVAVTAAARLIPDATAGLTRDDAFELGRLCAVRPDLNRVALRLWREFVFPPMCRVHGWTWAISYQDAVLHSGNLYRFDGWVRIGFSSSGPDARSGKRGRRKVIWGWSPKLADRSARQLAA
jgi:antitoxin VapB